MKYSLLIFGILFSFLTKASDYISNYNGTIKIHPLSIVAGQYTFEVDGVPNGYSGYWYVNGTFIDGDGRDENLWIEDPKFTYNCNSNVIIECNIWDDEWGDGGNYIEVHKWNINITLPNHDPNKPGIPDAYDITNNSAYVTWANASDPDPGDAISYDIQWSKRYAFGGWTPVTGVNKPYQITGLDEDTWYAVQVKARDNKDGDSGWTNSGHFKTEPENHAPYTPGNPEPDDGAENIDPTPTLRWSGGDPDNGDEVTYVVSYGKYTATSLDDLEATSNTYITLPTLEYGGHYRWKVTATDEHGASTHSHDWLAKGWDFTVEKVYPDLIVLDPDARPTTIEAGEKIDVSCIVKNQGKIKANFGILERGISYFLSTDTIISENDIPLGYTILNDFDAGEEREIDDKTQKIPSDTQSGDHYIIFYVDQPDNIDEGDKEENNTGYTLTKILKPAELVTNTDHLNFENIDCNGNTELNAILTNTGDFEASGSIELTGSDKENFNILSETGNFFLDGGESKNIKVQFNPTDSDVKNAKIRINGDNCPDVEILLTGQCELNECFISDYILNRTKNLQNGYYEMSPFSFEGLSDRFGIPNGNSGYNSYSNYIHEKFGIDITITNPNSYEIEVGIKYRIIYPTGKIYELKEPYLLILNGNSNMAISFPVGTKYRVPPGIYKVQIITYTTPEPNNLNWENGITFDCLIKDNFEELNIRQFTSHGIQTFFDLNKLIPQKELTESQNWYNGISLILNTILNSASLYYGVKCANPIPYQYGTYDDLYSPYKEAATKTARTDIDEISTEYTGQTKLKTQWNNQSASANFTSPDGKSGSVTAWFNYDRATCMLEIISENIYDDLSFDNNSVFSSIYSYIDENNIKHLVGIWYDYRIDKNLSLSKGWGYENEKEILVNHQSNIEAVFTTMFEFGPFKSYPGTENGGVYDYEKWKENPDDVYWMVIATGVSDKNFGGSYFKDVKTNLHLNQKGTVDLTVCPPVKGKYKVEVFNKYDEQQGLNWDWENTEDGVYEIEANEDHIFHFTVTPNTNVEEFIFHIKKQIAIPGLFSTPEKPLLPLYAEGEFKFITDLPYNEDLRSVGDIPILNDGGINISFSGLPDVPKTNEIYNLEIDITLGDLWHSEDYEYEPNLIFGKGYSQLLIHYNYENAEIILDNVQIEIDGTSVLEQTIKDFFSVVSLGKELPSTIGEYLIGKVINVGRDAIVHYGIVATDQIKTQIINDLDYSNIGEIELLLGGGGSLLDISSAKNIKLTIPLKFNKQGEHNFSITPDLRCEQNLSLKTYSINFLDQGLFEARKQYILKKTVSNTIPETPIPISPYSNEILKILSPDFKWSPYESPINENQAGYEIRIRCDDDNDKIVYETGFISGTTTSHAYSPNSYTGIDNISGFERISDFLEPGKKYHWHVRVMDENGNWSLWSSDDPEPHQVFYTQSLENHPPEVQNQEFTINENPQDE
ncbi:MAG: fibronectin type III domain-containing protein, partial [Mariniphaga sp.]|nr:fibronectin type III domain-containing protein [Mariniphaga sp.]